MKTDINKGTKVYYITDFTSNLHAFLQIFKLQNALLHDRGWITVTRVAVRLLKFINNVVDCCFTDIIFFAKCLTGFIADFFTFFNCIVNFTGNIIVFRVNPGVIKRVRAFCNLKEACTLFKGFWTKARNLFQIFAACDFSVCVAVSNNLLCSRNVNTRNVLQKHVRSCVKVYTNLVYNRAYNFIKLLSKLFLVYIVLVKSNADCLRVNFYKLSKRVLKTAAHRNSTANHYVKVREFFCSNRACRVNRSTRFINNSKFNIAVLVVFADNLTYNSLNFLRTGSVSNSQNLNVILINCVVDCVVGTLRILLLENLKEAKIFSCFIKGGTLCTVAVTRVNTKNAASLNWLLHQKVFKVFAEDSNSVVICIISFVTADFADNSRRKQTHNAVFNCILVIVIVDCGFFLKLCNCCININVDCNFKGTFAFTAVNSKNAVRFNLIKRL